MIVSSSLSLDQIPGEPFLITLLQKNINFLINNKVVRKGKLLLFKRAHYFIQIALASEKGNRENFEIPIPFKVENYSDEGLLYFDYRIKSLEVDVLPRIPEKVSSMYYDKILEIQIANIYT
jgi:hypothetical protein